ncbi:hypothetical protein FQ021_25515 [Escherichia coli]|nr:hypothetical protein [Escherichia coli]
MRAFFNVHYILIYHTVTSLTYVFVPLDFRPQYTLVSGPHGPAAGKFFNRVQQFSLLTDRIALQDRRNWRISGPSNAGIHFIHL